MSGEYIVFTRKWRPKTFEEIIGQEHVVIPLKRAIEQNRIMHAYLFSGPRGVGKTTTARVFAKSLNCEKGPTTKPCNKCNICTEINNGSSLDVIEIDGASNRGINEIRELREKVNLAPAKSKYKIYIIDEVHMLTKEAFNALLKTLEEPPKHVIFIFATTDPQQIPQTILSRCQNFKFKRLSINTIVNNLKMIAQHENIKYEENALFSIAKAADGALRDAQRIFDQAITYSQNNILTQKVIQDILGEVSTDLLNKLLIAILDKNEKEIIDIIENIFIEGYDLRLFIKSFIDLLQNFIIIKTIPDKIDLTISEEEKIFLNNIKDKITKEKIIFILKKLFELESQISRTYIPHILLESFFLDIILSEEKEKIKLKNESNSEKEKNNTTEENNYINTIEDKKRENIPIVIDEIEEKEEINELNIDIIKKRWESIIFKAKEKGEEEVSLGLSTSVLGSFENNSLLIIADNPFMTNVLKNHKEFIEDILKSEFEQNINIIIYDKQDYKKEVKIHKNLEEEEIKNHPAVKKLMQIFEIKDIKLKK